MAGCSDPQRCPGTVDDCRLCGVGNAIPSLPDLKRHVAVALHAIDCRSRFRQGPDSPQLRSEWVMRSAETTGQQTRGRMRNEGPTCSAVPDPDPAIDPSAATTTPMFACAKGEAATSDAPASDRGARQLPIRLPSLEPAMPRRLTRRRSTRQLRGGVCPSAYLSRARRILGRSR